MGCTFFFRLMAVCFYLKWYFVHHGLFCINFDFFKLCVKILFTLITEFFWCSLKMYAHLILALLNPKRKGKEKRACCSPTGNNTSRYSFPAGQTVMFIKKHLNVPFLWTTIIPPLEVYLKKSRATKFLYKHVHLLVIYNSIMLEITWLPNHRRFVFKNSVYPCGKMSCSCFESCFFKMIFLKNI